MKPSAGIRESATPSVASHRQRILCCRVQHFVDEGWIPGTPMCCRRARDVVIAQRAVLGEQSGDGMRRLGRVGDDGSGADPLQCDNLSMLRTTTPRRAMMDA